ncbi:hypothetical protein, partial [Acinetobacter junii]|uniref:hypothetical protein n=1 Tax=Acinetobacter junii TaxID=40215 RepID=UPI00125EC4A2
VTNPYRKRLYSMAVAAMDGRDRGRPSSWSAALDNAICDNLNKGLRKLSISKSMVTSLYESKK